MAKTFDVVTDFNNSGIQPDAGNPFTYGTETSLNTGFTLFPNFQANGTVSDGSGQFTTDGTLADYYISQGISGPSVGEVATGGPLNFSNAFTVPNGVLMMMPGDPSLGTPEIVVTRFTAPEQGVFDITGSFTNLEAATVSVAVLVNGTTEFSATFSGSGGTIPFSISDVLLAPGATVDFIVDSLGSRDSDVLGLTAQITEVASAPIMLDAVARKKFTTLSGTAEANSSVSIFDGTKPVGTVTAAADGTWSLQANLTGRGVHSYTETSTDASGNTLSSTGVTLFAQTAKQSLQGGSGNDVLIAGPNDTLTGDGGNNTFVFNSGFGKDTITDFNVSQDVLRFDHALLAQAMASQLISQTHDSSAGAVIVIDAHDTVTLEGVTVAQLAANPSAIQFF